MRFLLSRWPLSGLCVLAAVWLASAQAPKKASPKAAPKAAAASPEERLARHRNLGKAFYENPTTQAEAVAEFKKALDLAPNSVRERLNYGLALLRAAKTAEAFRELEAVEKADPKLPHPYFNLAIELKKQGEHEKALEQLRQFVALVPEEPISRYNMGVLLKLAGKPQEAIAEFEKAARLDLHLAAARFQLFNAYRVAGRQADSQRMLAEFQRLKKEQEGAAVPEDVDWCAYSEVYDPIDARKLAAVPVDVAFKFEDKVLAEGAAGVAIVNGTVVYWGKSGLSGVSGLRGVTAVAPGDFDNDGRNDLAVVTDSGVTLVRNGAVVTTFAGRYNHAVWLDYDHDYDLDLVLLGERSKLMRNQGPAGWLDRTADFPFAAGEALEGTAYRTVPDTRATDLVVSGRQRSVLYRDLLGGRFAAEPAPFLAAGGLLLSPADVDNNGTHELGYHLSGKPPLAADPDNSGRIRTDVQDRILPGAVMWAQGDLDRDGREDYAAVDANGRVHQLLNRTVSTNRSLRIRLTGVKNLLTAPYAEVEVKAGDLYQKKIYRGETLVFGLRNLATADTVRITWPNGLIQNETRQAAGREYTYKEAQRLSGSCPIIWTWDGTCFRYITDVLGVAPLGAAAGDGKFFDADHDEYIHIPGSALKAKDGLLEVRITEELSEVAFLDMVKLIAVDHPSDIAVYHNDKWKSPPYPGHRLWGVRRRIEPVAAQDDAGRDVRPSILAKDRTYPDAFRRHLNGIADMHHVTVTFPPDTPSNAAMILSGWVDWADGSTFLAASQEDPRGLVTPVLEARDASGRWVTIDADMGMPAGKPKSMVVPVHFPSRYRDLRISTNVCVYWDEIALSADMEPPPHVSTETALRAAALRFRGFSPNKVHPERKQPEEFTYEGAEPVSLWNPTPGRYTRYGPVDGLLTAADDRMVVMGSGDEVRLLFDAAPLPPVPRGWVRDYLLLVDGWAKDRDANTADSQTVLPLPFHRMSGYPFQRPGERHPDARYDSEFNTRPALRLIRPLTGQKARQ
jgi:tetratricopeptide (TPR) repeat protein